MTEIKDVLLKNQDQNELAIFLGSYFGNQSQTLSNKITYGDDQLIITYKKDSQDILSIIIDEKKVTKDDLISESKKALSINNGIQIQSIFLHSSVKINGYFKYKNWFQILPAPKNAPMLDSNLVLSSHPFNMEYSFLHSPNMQINIHRSNKASKEIILLLNALLRLGIDMKPRSSTHEWALIPSEKGFQCEYVNIGYFSMEADNRGKNKDGFTIFPKNQEFKFKDTKSYYTTHGISSEDIEVFLPDNFVLSIDKYLKLSTYEKDIFLRSSYWDQVAYKTFPISLSVAYNSLITSIETFLPDINEKCVLCNRPTSNECCSICKQPSSGPTQKFRDFVEKYAQGIDKSERNELYNIRSAITHGSKILPGDFLETGSGFNPKGNSEKNKWYLLSQIIKIIQINWLYSR